MMTLLSSWEDFEKAAERLYLQDPMKVGFLLVFLLLHSETAFWSQTGSSALTDGAEKSSTVRFQIISLFSIEFYEFNQAVNISFFTVTVQVCNKVRPF